MSMSKREYRVRIEELIWCHSRQEKIRFYLDFCDEQLINKTQRVEILSSLLIKDSENDIDNELRNLLAGSV